MIIGKKYIADSKAKKKALQTVFIKYMIKEINAHLN